MLYIVATPIGNLEDITLRALRVLREVDIIAAEDTRQTKKLLARYEIDTPLTSYHQHNERSKATQLVNRLEAGQSIALVSDAGTPTISDPGYHLVCEAVARGIPITSIPGASATTVALSASGMPTDRFTFEGFLPTRRHRRRAVLHARAAEKSTMVFYEAPHRIKETLADMHHVLGDRYVVVARELTKIHEEFLRGPLSRIVTDMKSRELRGEFVILLAGAVEDREVNDDHLVAEVQRLHGAGLKANEIAKALAELFSMPKREVYKMVLEEMARQAGKAES